MSKRTPTNYAKFLGDYAKGNAHDGKVRGKKEEPEIAVNTKSAAKAEVVISTGKGLSPKERSVIQREKEAQRREDINRGLEEVKKQIYGE